MQDWKPSLYLAFERERTLPAVDLTARIEHDNPKRIIDIGCGPGNSTAVLRARWTDAEIIGLDNSESMIDKAKSKYEGIEWLCVDADSDLSGLGKFDIIFSNAAVQWIPHNEIFLPKLFGMLNRGGVLAVQVPYTEHMPVQTELYRLTSSVKWRDRFADITSPVHSAHPADFYYNILCKLTADADLWQTDYYHVMNTHADIVKWYSGTGLRPYLECLRYGSAEFLEEYESMLREAYPIQSDRKILFPFTRIFFTAKK